MNMRTSPLVLSIFLCTAFPAGHALVCAQSGQGPNLQSDAAPRNYADGVPWFPRVWSSYQEQDLPTLQSENSPRLRTLIHDGKLELSLSDAVALALENNLDIAVQRFVLPFSQTDLLRTKSGSAARGFSGALIPSGLSAGALGAGVSAASSAGGLGSAGGITGGGGAVNIGPTGTFDPSLSFNFSWDRTTSPLNTLQVSGIPSVTVSSTSFSGAYAQLLPTGTSYFVGLNGLTQNSNQQFLRFNPAVITRFALGFNQPLLNGFGFLPNERFVMVARNNQRVAEEVFRQQVIATAVKVANGYWDLAAFQENVRVAEQSLAVAEKLLKENQAKAELGVMAPLDVTSAKSEVASRQRDLIVAQTNLQMQATTLKNIVSKKVDSELDGATIVIKDAIPSVQNQAPDLEKSLANAFENRPDLRQAQANLQNQNTTVRYTRLNLKPNLAVFGMYAGAGLDGNTTTTTSGAGGALAQAFGADYPEEAAGLSFSVPIRNRAAQADDLRAHFEQSQLLIGLQRTRNQVALEVRQAVIGIIQGKAQVEAAHQAVALARATLNAEQEKLAAGVSTSYNEILRERDLIAAQLAEVQANVNYAKALVEMDRATGATLEQNRIRISDAVNGSIDSRPRSGLDPKATRPEGK
jgi:outer membrane protein